MPEDCLDGLENDHYEPFLEADAMDEAIDF